ncbi:geranylgeranyl pyrophosphate synthase [Dimargaris cristalligena]|uniref:Geranylgeranyl pyrophosphate synthase n=1 Tax=Dimargaris cristalligena TaxID=215637 RepID=A0A4V1J4Z9_9FUNG|nr:geranylgeranyl pyrophosphate synthase [Dimargaris cristalligena]|eukprot:RKP37319.1 geranylgeranyl pyrophosphate synthase [Dimargaris cristalligena]
MAEPGKSFRTTLIQAFNYWLEVPETELAIITKIIDMLHTASLLIDDVEDDSELRRGIPVAHKIFGVAATINSANYVYFLALQEVCKLNKPKLVEVFTEELLHLHEGQGMDLHWRDSLICPTEGEYIHMVANKTGGLLRLSIKLMQHCSKHDADYVDLVNKLGIYFQVRDDFMNLKSTAYTDNKGFCEDLQEGKFSFPVIHSISRNPLDHQLISILKQRTSDREVKKYAIKVMERTNSFRYTLEFLHSREMEIREMVEAQGGNPILEKAFSKLAEDCKIDPAQPRPTASS